VKVVPDHELFFLFWRERMPLPVDFEAGVGIAWEERKSIDMEKKVPALLDRRGPMRKTAGKKQVSESRFGRPAFTVGDVI
jgi:hypothetical protein